MTTPAMRPHLIDIPAYRPGRAAPLGPDGSSFKLSSNESPFEPSAAVLDVLATAARNANRYPDITGRPLREALARRWDVPADDVAVGPGSVAVLRQVMQAFVAEGDEVVYAWRSFEAYPISVQSVGGRSVRVPLTDTAEHDLDAMARAITDRTRVVLLCSPNNPTGPAIHAAELNAFLDRVPPRVLVVLDEAYHEYATGDPEVPDGLDSYRSRPNVLVLRTFSKAYGLAGLRIGFAVAPTPVAAALHKTAIPFGLSSLAQEAGIAALTVEDALLADVATVVRERGRVRQRLLDLGYQVPQSAANCLWLPLGEQSEEFAARCERAGIAVRPFAPDGVRVTIAEPAANDAFLRVAEAAAAERG
jgi:histidinol-phosphate aminotransferase